MELLSTHTKKHLAVIVCLAFDHRAGRDEIDRFKQCIMACDYVLQSIELRGTFDFIVAADLPDFDTYHEKLNGMSAQLERLVTRYEASFVYQSHDKAPRSGRDRSMWIRRPDGFEKLDMASVEHVRAERDYVRIHNGAGNHLMHATLSSIRARLDPALFLQIHRSEIIRLDLVERLIHHGRGWRVRLLDGSLHSVSKPHVAELMQRIHSTPEPGPTPSAPTPVGT